MVNRFIAMVARVWSVMRGFRPFLIGPRPFGDRFPEKGFGEEHLRGKVCESVLLLFPPSVSFIDSHVPIAISGVMFVRGSSMGAGVP